MIYTVGEMAQKLGVPASTLRYYDKEPLHCANAVPPQTLLRANVISWNLSF